MSGAALRLAVAGIGRALPPIGADADWFDHRTRLGGRGYKYLPRAAQYLLAAAREALDDAAFDRAALDDAALGGAVDGTGRRRSALADAAPASFGVAVGTSHGATALHSDMDAVIRGEGAEALSPATAAYFSINLIPSRLATEHRFQGFNLPVTSTDTAGLESIAVGAGAVHAGRAGHLLAGATEYPASGTSAGPGDDGAVVLLAHRAGAGRARYGTVAVQPGFLAPPPGADPVARARAWFDRAAGRLGLDPADPVVLIGDDRLGEVFQKALGADRTPAAGGSLQATAAVADALEHGPPSSAVLMVAAQGNTALARIRRNGD